MQESLAYSFHKESGAVDGDIGEPFERDHGDDARRSLRGKDLPEANTPQARLFESLICEGCGESTTESRVRKFNGKTLCIPCFEQLDKSF